jgi:Ala-tRNA(Pro) deacylase
MPPARAARQDDDAQASLPAKAHGATAARRPNGFAMPASPENLFAFLADLAVPVETVEHAPLFTVEDSRALRGDICGGHTKNLFLKDKKGRLFLLVLDEAAAIDLKRVHEKIGAQGRVSFGSAELL